ncbi:MAG: BLUF domain-containing protein [Pseudomonadota bacterium]
MIFLDQRLERLAYISAATREFSPQDLIEMGYEARRNNENLRVTGMLLLLEGEFFQVLEGPTAAVEEIFSRICVDERNEWVTPLVRERPFRRVFRTWSMGVMDLPFDKLPKDVFFKAEWPEVKRRTNAEGQEFFGFLERFYRTNDQLARAAGEIA